MPAKQVSKGHSMICDDASNYILSTYSVIDLGRLEGSLAGIIAGFALTVSILLIQTPPGSREPIEFGRLTQLSLASFLVAFVAGFATAFNFIVIGAEKCNVARLAVQLIPASFALAQSYVYLFMGLSLVLFRHHLADEIRGFIGTVCGATLGMVGLNLAFSTLWSLAVWWNVKLSDLMADNLGLSFTFGLICVAPAVIAGVRITWSRAWASKLLSKRSAKWPRLYIRTAIVAIFFTLIASLSASFMSEDVPGVAGTHMRLVALLTVCLYGIVSGVAVAVLP